MFTKAEIAERFYSDQELRHNITLDLGKFTISLFALPEGRTAQECFAGTAH
jgi:hypothetical protein